MFLHRRAARPSSPRPVWVPRAERSTVRAVQTLVEAAPGGDHRLPALAAAAAMSVRHFARVFTAEVGRDPGPVRRARARGGGPARARDHRRHPRRRRGPLWSRHRRDAAPRLPASARCRARLLPATLPRRPRRKDIRHDRGTPAGRHPPLPEVHRPRRRRALRGAPAHPLHRRHLHRAPRGEVRSENGMLGITADATFDDLPEPDIIVFPGGVGTRPLEARRRVLDVGAPRPRRRPASRRRCARARSSSAPPGCSRASPPRRTGRATPSSRPTAPCPRAERVVEHLDRRIITAAGVSSGIDMALRLVELLVDRTAAQAAQLMIEYDPQPPFDCGSLAKTDDRDDAGDRVRQRAFVARQWRRGPARGERERRRDVVGVTRASTMRLALAGYTEGLMRD